MKCFLMALLIGVFPATAASQTFYSESGTAKFTSSVPLHNFTGASENLTGMVKLSERSIDFFLDLETLDTGNAKRDKDMLITLETEEYPFAEFFGELTTPFDPNSPDIQEAVVSGKFKIHGVENEVRILGSLQMTPEGLLVKASWVLNLKEYKIVPPSLLIVKVDENQKIEIEVLLEPYTEEN